jgi:phage gp36-like protein
MPYATQADLLQRISLKQLTQLTDDAGQNQPDATVVAAALEEASGLIDARVRDRYTTPLQASDTATAICRDICVYLLFTRRPQQISEAVRQRYEDAVSLLKEIAAGKASLDQPVSAAQPQSVPSGPVTPICQDIRFTECNLEGFV